MLTYQDYIEESEKENECGFCGEKCEHDFCNKECYKAYFND